MTPKPQEWKKNGAAATSTATPSTPSTPKPQEWKKHEGGVNAKAAPIPGTTSAAPTSGSASSAVSGGASSEVGLEELPATGPSTLWNGMIHPLLNMRFAGIAWYQGEANFADPPSYACHFPAFVKDARLKFGNPGMSFAFVQLAGYQLHDWSEIRNAQMTALKLPGVTFATALDLGDPSSPWDPVHSRRKQEVGRRLAMAAIFLRYGSWGGLHHHGPTFAPQRPIPVAFGEAGAGVPGGVRLATVDGNGGASPGTLHAAGTAGCELTGTGKCCGESPFQITTDAIPKWHRVAYRVEPAGGANGQGAVVLLTGGQRVTKVRYAWERYPQCLVYNGVGSWQEYESAIPAAPFCFDAVANAPCPVVKLPNPWAETDF